MPTPPAPDPGLEFAIKLYIEAVTSTADDASSEREALRSMAWQDIQERLAAGAEVNGASETPRGITTSLVALAILNDMFELADLLVASGASLEDNLGFPHASYGAACGRKDALGFLMRHGIDPCGFDREDMPLALATDRISSQLSKGEKLPPEQLRAQRAAGDGANPTPALNPFYREQIRSFDTGYGGAKHWLEPDSKGSPYPVFSFDRFGRSITRLPDGRLVLIAGEHEDSYDPDFFIYNDVCVLDGKGGIDYFVYPPEVFPPTDFHSATLVEESIWIVGCLGYRQQRQDETTPVFKLDLKSFKITPVETRGDNPGWICRHRATLQGRDIIVSGGKVGPKMRDNSERYALDTKTGVWRQP